MSDPSPGVDAGVRRTPIVVDDRGRRRNANGDVQKFPGVHDDPTREQARAVAALKAAFDAYVKANDARTVTGGGSAFSGNFGSGLIYNPFAAGSGPGGGGGGASEVSNPFIMPEGVGISPDGTTWSAEDPPDGYDGVLFRPVRFFVSATPDTTRVVSTPGGDVTLNSFIVWTFIRFPTFDNDGNLVAVSAEERLDAAVSPTQVTF